MIKQLKAVAKTLKRELWVYRRVIAHPQTPWLAKALLGLAVTYVLWPFDLIPDFLPVIGHLDDAVIVPVLIVIALKLIPKQILDDCRENAS